MRIWHLRRHKLSNDTSISGFTPVCAKVGLGEVKEKVGHDGLTAGATSKSGGDPLAGPGWRQDGLPGFCVVVDSQDSVCPKIM